MAESARKPGAIPETVLSSQATFRAVMEALARPGRVQEIAAMAADRPAPLMPATAAIARALFDHDTPIWCDAALATERDVATWLTFHTGAPVVTDPSIAAFALVADPATMPSIDRFAFGTNEYPDRSTTLILQVESLTEGPAVDLQGPGIKGSVVLNATLPPGLIDSLRATHGLFPRGLDVILVAEAAIMALPRTTRFAMKER